MDMETEKLLRSVVEASTVSEALHYVEKEKKLTPLCELLADYMATHDLATQQMANLIDVERSTLYRLLSGERLTTRNVVLRIALAFHLSIDETQELLRSGQRAELYAPVRRDAVILFCINHGFTLAQTEEALARKNEASLYERM